MHLGANTSGKFAFSVQYQSVWCIVCGVAPQGAYTFTGHACSDMTDSFRRAPPWAARSRLEHGHGSGGEEAGALNANYCTKALNVEYNGQTRTTVLTSLSGPVSGPLTCTTRVAHKRPPSERGGTESERETHEAKSLERVSRVGSWRSCAARGSGWRSSSAW